MKTEGNGEKKLKKTNSLRFIGTKEGIKGCTKNLLCEQDKKRPEEEGGYGIKNSEVKEKGNLRNPVKNNRKINSSTKCGEGGKRIREHRRY